MKKVFALIAFFLCLGLAKADDLHCSNDEGVVRVSYSLEKDIPKVIEIIFAETPDDHYNMVTAYVGCYTMEEGPRFIFKEGYYTFWLCTSHYQGYRETSDAQFLLNIKNMTFKTYKKPKRNSKLSKKEFANPLSEYTCSREEP